jgi:hypothetical protein
MNNRKQAREKKECKSVWFCFVCFFLPEMVLKMGKPQTQTVTWKLTVKFPIIITWMRT